MGINLIFKVSTTRQEAMRHFPLEIFFLLFLGWLVGFWSWIPDVCETKYMERKEGKSYGQSKLGPCWLEVWQLNSPSSPLHHLGPPALPVQDLPKGKTKLKWEPWDEQALGKHIQFSKNGSFHAFTQANRPAFIRNPSNNSQRLSIKFLGQQKSTFLFFGKCLLTN